MTVLYEKDGEQKKIEDVLSVTRTKDGFECLVSTGKTRIVSPENFLGATDHDLLDKIVEMQMNEIY